MGFEIVRNEKDIDDFYENGDIVLIDNNAYLMVSVGAYLYHFISLKEGMMLNENPFSSVKAMKKEIIMYANSELDEYNQYEDFEFYKQGTYDLKLYLKSQEN